MIISGVAMSFMVLVVAFNLWDAMATHEGIFIHRGKELNPIMASLIKDLGTKGLWIPKLLASLFLFFSFYYITLNHDNQNMIEGMTFQYGLGAILYAGVVGWNLHGLRIEHNRKRRRSS